VVNVKRVFQLEETSSFTDINTGWITGEHIILKTTSGGEPIGIEPISFEIPKEYLLSQNYPNPFNPITNIGFQIADFGFVSLKVYDVTGREVATVVSEKLAVGKYEINWNASGLGSGVYLYQLQTGKYTQTRKLILLR